MIGCVLFYLIFVTSGAFELSVVIRLRGIMVNTLHMVASVSRVQILALPAVYLKFVVVFLSVNQCRYSYHKMRLHRFLQHSSQFTIDCPSYRDIRQFVMSVTQDVAR